MSELKLLMVRVVYSLPNGTVKERLVSPALLQEFTQQLNGNECRLIELIMDKEREGED